MEIFKSIGDLFLFMTTPIVIGAGLLLSFKTRFIQFRKIPYMLKLFFSLLFKRGAKETEGTATVQAHKALLTAMSTTIGISTIVSPVIAIRLGGPGAVIGFLLATLLGSAVNFTEVTFALSYRKHHPGKGISGGPMQYLQDEISPFLAKFYAFFATVMLIAWSGAQSNQLAQILNSPILGKFQIPLWVSGIFLAIFVLVILIGGIKRIANFSAKLVPIMFLIYVSGALWIIFVNLEKLPSIFKIIYQSALAPQSFAAGITVGGIVTAMRWGVFKGLHSNEAGVGTQTIPHSMAETEQPVEQGILAMLSTYSAGFICILSSLVTLVTATWMSNDVTLGINMVAASFQSYFAAAGVAMVAISALCFAFGTILGNCYNGSQCFSYLTKNRYLKFFYLIAIIFIFVGCIMDVAAIWGLTDYILVLVVVPHTLSILYLSYKQNAMLAEPPPALAKETPV